LIKYIELDGKVPKHSFDTFSTTHEHYQDAGIILNNKIVVVDFDMAASVAKEILKEHPTLAVHTSRGMHLYYRRPKGLVIKNWTGKLTISGVAVDYKTGPKSMASIKQKGNLRKMSNEHYLSNLDGVPDLPVLLYPSKLKDSLYDLSDGQGRNSALFTHLLTSKEMYVDVEVPKLADFINQSVFATPLSKSELTTLVESVGSKKTSTENNKWLDPKDVIMTSEVLAEKLDIKYYHDTTYFKLNNRFIHNENKLLREIDKLIKLKPTQHKALMQLFPIKGELIEEEDMPVKFQNGHVLIGSDPLKMDYGFTPYYLDVCYDDQAYDENVDKFLDFFTMDRKDLRMVIEEMFGHILMTNNFPHKVFFFTGASGNNGKSTFLEMLNEFTGDLSINLSLNDFNDATSVYHLEGKLVNIGDDIDASFLEQSKNFKTLASGNTIMVRPIYQQPFKLKNKATLIFTCNEMPTFKDKSGGIARRVVVIPCDNTVTTIDTEIDKKLSSDSAKSYLLKLAIAGIKRIEANGGKLSESLTIQAKTKEYFTSSDSVLRYESEFPDLIVKSEAANVYNSYVAYCEQNGLKEVGKPEFGRRLKTIGYTSKQKWMNKKNRLVYVKEDEKVSSAEQIVKS
jgi:putative DNA primase/helicase